MHNIINVAVDELFNVQKYNIIFNILYYTSDVADREKSVLRTCLRRFIDGRWRLV